MDFEHSAQSRGERLISSIRSLAALGLLALLRLDPAFRSLHGGDVLWLLGVYALYALLLAGLFWAYDRIELRSRLAVHALDLAVFAVLCVLIRGAAAVALVFYAFLLLAGALRWRWRGALGTALAGLAVYLGVGVALEAGLSAGWLAGGACLALLAVLLTAVSAYQQRLSREMLKIAAWPRGPLQDADALLAHLLARVAGILEAPRVLLAWEEADEPWLYLAQWSAAPGGRLERSREAPLETPLVPAALAAASFLSNGAGETWHSAAGGVERWRGEPLDPALRRRFAIGRVASWPVRGETVQGRLFALDRRDLERDHLVLGEIVAQRVAAELDQFYLTRQLRTAAVTDERVRLACDLHDGMLQSLTGTALQLQALSGLLDKDPPSAPAQLREIQRLIAGDQRDLRFFIEELKPVPTTIAGQDDLATRLAELSDRLKRLWDLNIDVHLEELDGRLSEALTRQLYRLLREALFNVARHAQASSVRVEVSSDDRALSITVTDDGRGFPFTGRYGHEELNRRKLGPVSLKERIAALGGSLAIDTGPGLTRLEMHLPAQGGAR
ncbi:MAG TPA: sensor histidine kinase [Thermoanaerobaculia bacterium]|jgi:signal transduction histidine kinase